MSTNGYSSMDTNINDEDELLMEIDVEIRRCPQSFYLFQYPLRPRYQSYDEICFTNARIKEKSSQVEMDLLIETDSVNYYGARGKQFADTYQQDHGKNFFSSDRMDKQTIASTNSRSGNCYMVGLFDPSQRQLVICPLKSILQLRPQFNYLDPSNATGANQSNKENNLFDDEMNGASDGEQSGSESEEVKAEPKAILVTQKFARKESEYHKNKRLQSYSYYRQLCDEERWQDLVCIMNANSFEAQRLREEILRINNAQPISSASA